MSAENLAILGLVTILGAILSAAAYIVIKRLGRLYWLLEAVRGELAALRSGVVNSSQSEALAFLYRLLEWEPGTLPATRGWAASPDFLVILAEHVLDRKPRRVVELGCGVTSLVIARALQLNGGGELVSVDHDPTFAAITRNRLRRLGLETKEVQAPLVASAASAPPWYDFQGTGEPIDLLVVDGPPLAFGEQVRGGAARLFGDLSDGGVVMLDDAGRPGERTIAERWAQEWPQLRQTFIGTEKGTLLIFKALPE